MFSSATLASVRSALQICSALLVLTASAVTHGQGTRAVRFDIPAQPLSAALLELARQANIGIAFSASSVLDLQSPALQGRFEIGQALERLLERTDLVVLSPTDGVYSVVPRAPPEVPRSRSDPVQPEYPPPSVERPVPPIEQISVTGSRIVRDGLSAPTPVAVISSRELNTMAPTTLMDSLAQMPQFANNNTAVGFADGVTGPAGASHLNLRGVGPNRTLVLMDGRRVAPSTRRGMVNIALFPKALIDRVELVTGGASAAYGSDAVSGVANLMLKRGFSGLDAQIQGGRTTRSDNDTYEVSMAGGISVGERGHLLFGAEHMDSEGIRGYGNRGWFRSWGNIANPDPDGPAQIIVPHIRSRAYTYGGVIPTGPLAGTQFLEGGVPAPFQDGHIVTPMYQAGGSGVDDAARSTWVLPDQRRSSGLALFEYVVRDGLRIDLQGMYGNSITRFNAVPSTLLFSNIASIQADNAFLPESLRTRMSDGHIESFEFARLAREDDLGAALVSNDARMLSVTAGFEWRLGAWRLDGYYQRGRAEEFRHWDQVVRLDRLYRAIDAVHHAESGRIVCRSTLTDPGDGCVPMNLFGAGAPSREAKEYVWTQSYADQKVTQEVGEFSVQGPLADWRAGTVSMAAGVAYRTDAFEQKVGPQPLASMVVPAATESGYLGQPAGIIGAGLFERANPGPLSGRYRVREGFLETLVPVAAGGSWMGGMNLMLAARYADYSGSGGVWAWKTGLDWSITEDWRLRATRSRDVRAGNLAERFDKTERGATITSDPLAPGVAPYVISQLEGGNPQIDPEAADALTFGFVLHPQWLPGIGLSVDYYDVRVRGAIDQLGVQRIVEQCYSGDDALCEHVNRSPHTGLITDVHNVYLNVAESRGRGVDLEVSYMADVEPFGVRGRFMLRGFATYMAELSSSVPGETRVDRAGQTGRYVAAPRLRALLGLSFRTGAISADVQKRYISAGKRDVQDVVGVDIDDNRVSSIWYLNARLGYTVRRVETFVSVTNFLDRDPPKAPTANVYGTVHTNEELFDPLGRRYMLGLRLQY